MKAGIRHQATGNSQRIKILGFALSAMIFAFCDSTEAQQPPKLRRIGWLAAGTPSGVAPLTGAFREGLRQLGHVEGKTFVMDYRYAEGNFDRLPGLAAELLQLKVDVIVAANERSIDAAKRATGTTPIVMIGPADPVGAGLIKSLARPGGNLTGLSFILTELAGKRLELLKEAFPKLSRVALLRSSAPVGEQHMKETEATAQALGVQVQSVQVKGPADFENAF